MRRFVFPRLDLAKIDVEGVIPPLRVPAPYVSPCRAQVSWTLSIMAMAVRSAATGLLSH